MIGEIADSRRFEASKYLNPKDCEKLGVLIALDNELWAIKSRAREELIIRIRLQYWLDEVEKIKQNQIITTPISQLIYKNFANQTEILDGIINLINAHIEGLEFYPNRKNDVKIWENYFISAFKIFDCNENEIAKYCANIVQAANLGDFNQYKNHNLKINQLIKNLKQKEKIIPIIALVKLCKNPILFNDIIIDQQNHRLGIRAKFAIFGAVLFCKI